MVSRASRNWRQKASQKGWLAGRPVAEVGRRLPFYYILFNTVLNFFLFLFFFIMSITSFTKRKKVRALPEGQKKETSRGFIQRLREAWFSEKRWGFGGTVPEFLPL